MYKVLKPVFNFLSNTNINRVACICALLIFGTSCSTHDKSKNSKEPIACQSVEKNGELSKTIDHLEGVINSQTELSPSTKENFLSLTRDAVQNYERLRREEIDILRILISKSLRHQDLSMEELKNKDRLIVRLDKVFKEKERIILNVIDQLKNFSKNNGVIDQIESDMIEYVESLL